MLSVEYGKGYRLCIVNGKLSNGRELGSNEPVLHGKARGSSARLHAQLFVDGGQMRVDGAPADDKPFSDLDIGQSLRYQAQYLYLSRSESRRIDGVNLPGQHRWGFASKLFRYHHRLPCRDNLLQRHHSSLGPSSGKSILTQLCIRTGHHALIVSPHNSWHLYTSCYTEILCLAPQPRCPGRLL